MTAATTIKRPVITPTALVKPIAYPEVIEEPRDPYRPRYAFSPEEEEEVKQTVGYRETDEDKEPVPDLLADAEQKLDQLEEEENEEDDEDDNAEDSLLEPRDEEGLAEENEDDV